MISVVIPSRHEPYLKKTIEDILSKARGTVEVIAVLDGYWPPANEIVSGYQAHYIHLGATMGMRFCVNAGIIAARYPYILKCDAHCMFDKGFDLKLMSVIDQHPDWCVIPVRKRLDPVKWELTETHKPFVEYMTIGKDYRGKISPTPVYTDSTLIDTPTFQGSCYFVNKDRFIKLGLLDDENYGGSGHEAQEISFAYLLSGGRVVRTRDTWYAHWHKDKRGFGPEGMDVQKSRAYMKKFVEKNKSGVQKIMENQGLEPTLQFRQSSDGEKNCQSVLTKDISEHFRGLKKKKDNIVEGYRRRHLMEDLGKFGLVKGAEIGVRTGRFSEVICKSIPGHDIVSVDPYYLKDERSARIGKNGQEAYYQAAKVLLEPYNCRLVRQTSSLAAQNFNENSLDFVYIDGNHEFDFVMEDLIIWSRIVRSGGVVAGHDYYKFKNAGVVRAVDIYRKEHGIKEWYLTDERSASFFWVKP